MSVQALAFVLEESPVDVPLHRLALLSLANHAHADGTGAYPSVATIARESKQSPRNAQYALRALEADQRIRRMGTTSRGTTIWAVLMDARAAAAPYTNASSRGGATVAPPPAAPVAGPGAQPVAPGGAQPPAPEPSAEPSEPPSREGGSEGHRLEEAAPFYRRPGGADRRVAPGHDLGPEPPPALEQEQLAAWAKIRTQLQEDVAEMTWHTWLAQVELVSWQGTELALAAPDHLRSWVRDRYIGAILATAGAVVGHELTATIGPLPPAAAPPIGKEIQ